jgi:hypothetical protein
MPIDVDFEPTKQLFIDVLTKDISIRDCILDLLDNSVDSYVRHKTKGRRKIALDLNGRIAIVDNCGGISKDDMEKEVFRFGVSKPKAQVSTIGFYGIGLKRALFKLGKSFVLETDDGRDYCKLDLTVDEWLTQEGWKHEGETRKSRLQPKQKPYTKIVVKELREETKEIFTDVFVNDLRETIRIYYTLYSQKRIDFSFRGKKLAPFDLKIRVGGEYSPANVFEEIDGVQAKITCWIEPSEKRTEKVRGYQGWNVFMNDRLVIHDDVSEATGWSGEDGQLPKMHPIYNQFRGLVFLNSKDPSRLPINTMKNGFNTENKVYHRLLKLMTSTARPLVKYLSGKYDQVDEKEQQIVERVTNQEMGKIQLIDVLKLKTPQQFSTPTIRSARVTMPTIKYRKPKEKVDKVKKYLKVRTYPEVGSRTFDYFLSAEGLDNE